MEMKLFLVYVYVYVYVCVCVCVRVCGKRLSAGKKDPNRNMPVFKAVEAASMEAIRNVSQGVSKRLYIRDCDK